MFDTLIIGGWLADGTGNPTYPADVAIQGDRIIEVGRLAGAEAGRVIDAGNKIVCPGFIDSHSHSDRTVQSNPTNQSTVRQGITTEIVGQCGSSPAPLSARSRDEVRRSLRGLGYEGPVEWSTFGEYLDFIDDMGTSINFAWLVGHNALRNAVGAVGTDVSEAQMQRMEAMVHEAMQAGAIGISTGLEFAPGRLASTEEVVRLAKVAGEYDGCYVSHIRNRDKYIQVAIEEFIDIVRRSGTIGQVSHLNVRHNTGAPEGAWQRAVDTLAAARDEGIDIGMDCTPFVDGGGNPTAILPPWVVEEGPEHAADLLEDPQVRERVKGECDRYWAFIPRGDWDRLRVLRSEKFPELRGKNFFQIAEMWDQEPWDCLFDLFVLQFRGEDQISYVGRLFTEEHVANQIRHPLFNLAVDAHGSATEGVLAEKFVHPLSYAGMVHYLTYWVREKHVLRLEEAIRKMTSMPATHHRLRDRGLLRPGAYADVVVFDYEELDDVSTLEEPVAYAEGIEYVLVNGDLVIDDGEHTRARPGRNLRS